MLFKAFVRLATRPARIYQEDPDRPEEFTREALLRKELMAVYVYFSVNGLYGPTATPTGVTPDGEEIFGADYGSEPPSFYDEVKEYFPVWKIKLAAAGE